MIKGHLKTIILTELEQSSQTGYELMRNFKEKTGKAPSPGSLYPVLAHLLDDGFILLKEEGRKKIYRISAKGKKYLTKKIQEKQDTVQGIINIISEADIDDSCDKSRIIKFYQLASELHLKRMVVFSGLETLKDSFISYLEKSKNKDLDNKVQEILEKAAKEIKKLK